MHPLFWPALAWYIAVSIVFGRIKQREIER